MTGWDGEGTDPWLPSRLRDLAGLSAAERDVYRGFWSELSAWLVEVARAVLSGRTPDPLAVYSRVPEWAERMAEFTERDVAPVMRRAYVALLGEGYDWDARPYVATYLTGVHNRMTRTSDQVFDRVATEVNLAAQSGLSIPDTADRIAEVLDSSDAENWEGRTTVVARTETIGALNAGRTDAFRAVAEELADEVTFERMWLATADTRTRPTHRAADLQRVPLDRPFTVGGFHLDQPGDVTAPPQETVQCRCTTILLEQGEDVDLTDRQLVDD